jgi:hypothetical protein
MLDSAFLAAQVLYTDHKGKFNLSTAITSSLQRMLAAYQHAAE